MADPTPLKSIDDLADVVIRRLRGTRSVTAIAGAPGSGKSTAAATLVATINARVPGSAAVFPMDGYHYDDIVLEQRGWRHRKGAPETFDVAGFSHTLARLRRNDEPEVAVPVFDRTIEIARAGARIIPQSVRYLVVEGNYLLLDEYPWNRLADQFDLTVFIDVAEPELRRRLLKRWAELSGTALREKLEGNDLPNARLVQTRSRPAEYVIAYAG